MACLAAQPIVHGLETDLAGQATVVRLDLFSEDGRAFFTRHALNAVPAIVVLDPSGAVRYRGIGVPNPAPIRQAVRESTAPPGPAAPTP
jgi:hypothetical protein